MKSLTIKYKQIKLFSIHSKLWVNEPVKRESYNNKCMGEDL